MIENIVLVIIVIVLLVGIGLLVSSMNSNSEDDADADEDDEDDEDEDDEDDEDEDDEDEDTGTDKLPLKTVGGTQYKAIQNYLLFKTANFEPDGNKHTLETCAATAKARGASAFTFKNDNFLNDYEKNECYGYVQIPDGTDTSTIFDPQEVSSTFKVHDAVGGQGVIWTLNPNWFTGCVNQTRNWPYCGPPDTPSTQYKTGSEMLLARQHIIFDTSKGVDDTGIGPIPGRYTANTCAATAKARGALSFTFTKSSNTCIGYKDLPEKINTTSPDANYVTACIDPNKLWPYCGSLERPGGTSQIVTNTVPYWYDRLSEGRQLYSSHEAPPSVPFTLETCAGEGLKRGAASFTYYGKDVPSGYIPNRCILYKAGTAPIGDKHNVDNVFTGCVDQTKSWPQCVGGDKELEPNPSPVTTVTSTGSTKVVPGLFTGLWSGGRKLYSSSEVTPNVPFTIDECISKGSTMGAASFLYYGQYVPYGFTPKSCVLFKSGLNSVGTATPTHDVYAGCVNQTKEWPQCAYS